MPTRITLLFLVGILCLDLNLAGEFFEHSKQNPYSLAINSLAYSRTFPLFHFTLNSQAARTLQQVGDSGTELDSSSTDAVGASEDTTALDTNGEEADSEEEEEEINVFNFYLIPWELGIDYSLFYRGEDGEDGIVLPVGTTLAWSWGDDVHGVYRIPTEECPNTFRDGLNGMEAIQEPVNGLSRSGDITVLYNLDEAGVYYFACPVGKGLHCLLGMKIKVTVVDD